jgi:hypothetical protein
LQLESSDSVAFSVAPSLELGGQMVLDDDSILRPYVQAGATLNTGPGPSVSGSLVAGGSTDSFTVSSSPDQVLFNVSAGIDLLRTEGETVRAYYNRTIGQTTDAQYGGMKLSINF